MRSLTMLFTSQICSGNLTRRFAYLMGLIALCATTLPAQVSFLGAQQTVPATGLSGPNGAALDSFGNLYVVDTGNNRVVKIAPTGTQTAVSVAPLTLNSPRGVAIDTANNLYVTDNGNNRVVKIPSGGGNATAFATVVTPDGLAIDANGNLFVTDNEDGSIIKVTSAGATSTFETGLSDPVDVAVDTAGNVYLADGLLNNIVKFPAAGGSGTNLGSSLFSISGVAVDRAGNVYVAESGEGALIVEITPSGTQTTLATSGLFAVTYFTVDSNYDLFIPDNLNNNVIEFSTISVPLGYANVCQGGAPAPCIQTASLQFAVGEASIGSVSVVTVGIGNLDFGTTEGSNCSGSTTPCTVVVDFVPTAPGLRSGSVSIIDTCENDILDVPVYGFGNAANAVFTPALASGPIPNDGFVDPTAVTVAGAGVLNGGPIFIADDEACVVWIIDQNIEGFNLYAGNGTCGYAGDGGPATGSAELNSPEDVTLDGAGNLYIADTGNGVIRKVTRSGAISTVVGDNDRAGGFFGDGGPAIDAGLNGPNGIAFDLAGNLYIADSGNNRIRKVDLSGIITTVAGSNQSGFSGDGGPATSAKLNTPFGVRADAAGNLFIADTGNNVVRKVDLTGKITTVAGNFSLGPGYSGDGHAATGAQLHLPAFVSIDPSGALYIADNGNKVIRLVDGSGNISTYPIPESTDPTYLTVDPTGNLAVVDPTEEALLLFARTIPAGLDFGNQNVNTASTPQDVTVSNIGNQPLNFSAIVPPGGFNLSGPDTSCSTSSTLNAGLSCILGIVFDPPAAGGIEDSIAVTDNSLGPAASATQNIGVTGTGVAVLAASTTTLAASPTTAVAGQTVTLTATIAPVPTGTLGSVDFCLGLIGPDTQHPVHLQVQRWPVHYARRSLANAFSPQDVSSCGGGTLLGTVSVGANGVAMLAVTSLPTGANIITAVYSGNSTLALSTSDPVTVTINAAASTTTAISISPNPGFDGQSVTLTGTVTPIPTSSPMGTITFCDSGSAGPTVRQSATQLSPKTRHPFGTGIRRNGGAGPCGADTALGTANVNAQGIAILMLTTLTVGDHNIYAVYSGSTGFLGSVSDSTDEPVDAAYTVAAPQTPFDVSEGGSVQITITVPPLGGSFNGVVTLTATGLPPRATATFNPPTVTPGSAGAQTVMTIQLASAGTQHTASLPAPPTPPIPTWPLAGMGILLVALRFCRQSWSRFAAAMLAIALISSAAITLTGCNGGFAGLSTPKGQFIVTVTGTSGSLHPSTTVTVVVQ